MSSASGASINVDSDGSKGSAVRNPEELKVDQGKTSGEVLMKKYNLKNIIEVQKKYIELK